ncbi:MAG: hypothetical protein ABSE70_12000 [Candidatus Limnocylindrales bacterium]
MWAKLVAFGEITRVEFFRTPQTKIAWVRSGSRYDRYAAIVGVGAS